MKVVVTVQHPGHVHFFKHAIRELETAGHEVHVFARENEVTAALLSAYGIDYEMLAGASASLPSLARVQVTYESRLLARAWKIDPDVIAAIGGVAASHVAAAVGARGVVFYDTEHASLIKRLAYPFADEVCTPDCYTEDEGDKHVRYPGYHELAYLHPSRYTPDASVLDDAGVDPDDPLVVCRFSSWDSSHDVGQGGFDDLTEVVERLESTGATVQLTAEVDLPPELADRELSVAPERMHDLLYYADLTVGEGATTATESALLGTPAVYVNSLRLGYTTELAEEYGLVFQYNGPNRHEEGVRRALELLGEADGERWERRRARVLEDKRDVTDVVVDRVLAGG
ncbi:DUF354 domain-containing protein [Halosimplex sp. TS25]|uniref:DUF354 domain-containing protein n=1 Tax=Halosimplex rarum TaxID=3396619 RepID=UPI0039E97642